MKGVTRSIDTHHLFGLLSGLRILDHLLDLRDEVIVQAEETGCGSSLFYLSFLLSRNRHVQEKFEGQKVTKVIHVLIGLLAHKVCFKVLNDKQLMISECLQWACKLALVTQTVTSYQNAIPCNVITMKLGCQNSSDPAQTMKTREANSLSYLDQLADMGLPSPWQSPNHDG